jgi:hypothetical protein
MKKLALAAAMGLMIFGAMPFITAQPAAAQSWGTIYDQLRYPSYAPNPNPYNANTGLLGRLLGGGVNYSYYPEKPGLVGQLLGTGAVYSPYDNQRRGLLGRVLGSPYTGSNTGIMGRLFGGSVNYQPSLKDRVINRLFGLNY